MDDLRLTRKLVQRSGDAIIKADADGQQQVRPGNRHVGPISPVHPQHSQAEWMRRREASQPHQRWRDRKMKYFRQPQQFFRCSRMDDAAAHVEHRTLGRKHSLQGALNLLLVRAQ